MHAWILLPDKKNVPGNAWRESECFGIWTEQLTHHFLHECVSISNGIKDARYQGFRFFITGLQRNLNISRKESYGGRPDHHLKRRDSISTFRHCLALVTAGILRGSFECGYAVFGYDFKILRMLVPFMFELRKDPSWTVRMEILGMAAKPVIFETFF